MFLSSKSCYVSVSKLLFTITTHYQIYTTITTRNAWIGSTTATRQAGKAIVFVANEGRWRASQARVLQHNILGIRKRMAIDEEDCAGPPVELNHFNYEWA